MAENFLHNFRAKYGECSAWKITWSPHRTLTKRCQGPLWDDTKRIWWLRDVQRGPLGSSTKIDKKVPSESLIKQYLINRHNGTITNPACMHWLRPSLSDVKLARANTIAQLTTELRKIQPSKYATVQFFMIVVYDWKNNGCPLSWFDDWWHVVMNGRPPGSQLASLMTDNFNGLIEQFILINLRISKWGALTENNSICLCFIIWNLPSYVYKLWILPPCLLNSPYLFKLWILPPYVQTLNSHSLCSKHWNPQLGN